MIRDLQPMRDQNWNFQREELLYAYVGAGYTWDDLAKIRDMKRSEAEHAADMLRLEAQDVVLDIGSGFGHLALVLAPRVQQYVCADISAEMMAVCRDETRNMPNVDHIIIPRTDVRSCANRNINKVFANSVFIHVVFFELVSYLRQIYDLLPIGGRFYFNFYDSDYLGQAVDGYFESMLERYYADPLETTLMHWNSFTSIRAIAQLTGFELDSMKKAQYGAVSVSFVKYK